MCRWTGKVVERCVADEKNEFCSRAGIYQLGRTMKMFVVNREVQQRQSETGTVHLSYDNY